MATERPRFMVSVPDELFKQIEDYRFENRFQNRSDAINKLIGVALEYLKKEKLEDEYLLALALDREKNGSGKFYSEKEIMRELGITEQDIEEAEDLEIE